MPRIFLTPGVAKIVRGQPQIQLPDDQTDSSQLGRLRVPALQTRQLLLHVAPQCAARYEATSCRNTHFYSRWHFNSPFWVLFLICSAGESAHTSFTKFPFFFSRFTRSSRRGAAQPPDPRRAVNSALPDASAAAASQHHQPQRKLRRHEEGGRHPADPRAVAPGKSWGRKTFLLHLFVSPNELKLNQEITDVLRVWQGVRADPTLHAALGS